MSWLILFLWLASSIWALAHLLLNKKEPASTVSWMLFVLLFPIAGAGIYYLIGPEQLARRAMRRKEEIESDLSDDYSILNSNESILPDELSERDKRIFKFATSIADYKATAGNHVEILADPKQALEEMQERINSATEFIHLEYYIISSDEVTEQIFTSLINAKKRGVEVRVLYDALGSLTLKKIYFRKLTEAGIQISGFLPLSSIYQRFNLNFRNHRKILIIDGKLAFTGGTNIGKQYLGGLDPSRWHDYTVKVEGPAVLQLQDVFAKDWHYTTQKNLFQKKYYPPPSIEGDAIVQVLESSPDSEFHALHQVVLMTLHLAEEEILMTTPYFIPDGAMRSALTIAALKGVNVDLILPEKSDAPLVQLASRSFYDHILKAGVEIYEYQPRILHAKLMTIDNKWTIVGSANMDTRSFKLNFELNLLVYSSKLSQQAAHLFEQDLNQSKEVILEDFEKRPTSRKMLENACRLFSPLM